MDSTYAQEALQNLYSTSSLLPYSLRLKEIALVKAATVLWPIVAYFRGGFHRRDHYFFSQAVSYLSNLSTTPEPRPCELILSPNYQLAMN